MFSVARHVVRQLNICRPLEKLRIAEEDFERVVLQILCLSQNLSHLLSRSTQVDRTKFIRVMILVRAG